MATALRNSLCAAYRLPGDGWMPRSKPVLYRETTHTHTRPRGAFEKLSEYYSSLLKLLRHLFCFLGGLYWPVLLLQEMVLESSAGSRAVLAFCRIVQNLEGKVHQATQLE